MRHILGSKSLETKVFPNLDILEKSHPISPAVYSDEDKEFVIKNSVRYLFASEFTLLQLRIEHIYNAQVFKERREDLVHDAGISPTVAYVISRLPIPLLKLYFRLYADLRGIARKFIHREIPINPTRKTDVPQFYNVGNRQIERASDTRRFS